MFRIGTSIVCAAVLGAVLATSSDGTAWPTAGDGSAVQIAGRDIETDYWTRLSSVLAELIDLQFFDGTPLLRTTALQALDAKHKEDVVTRSNRLARRFAGMLIDGVADGSVRAIDPLVAGQVLMSTVNSAYDARHWAARFDKSEDAVKTYLSVMAQGMITAPA